MLDSGSSSSPFPISVGLTRTAQPPAYLRNRKYPSGNALHLPTLFLLSLPYYCVSSVCLHQDRGAPLSTASATRPLLSTRRLSLAGFLPFVAAHRLGAKGPARLYHPRTTAVSQVLLCGPFFFLPLKALMPPQCDVPTISYIGTYALS